MPLAAALGRQCRCRLISKRKHWRAPGFMSQPQWPGPASGTQYHQFARDGLPAAAALLAALCTALVPVVAVAQEAAAPKIKPLFVDADDPGSWPKGLEPISAAQLMRLVGPLAGPGQQPPAAEIERAVYQAAFRDGRLCDGKARFVVAQSGPAAALVPLGEPSLLLVRPRWIVGDEDSASKSKTEAALWGTDPTGRRVLIAEPGRSRLVCDWSLSGRPLLGASDFTFVVPPAVVSQVFLTLPDGWSVDCSPGVVSNAPSSSAGQTVWQIDLGKPHELPLADRAQSGRGRPSRGLSRSGHGLRRECRQVADPVETAVRCLRGTAHVVFSEGSGGGARRDDFVRGRPLGLRIASFERRAGDPGFTAGAARRQGDDPSWSRRRRPAAPTACGASRGSTSPAPCAATARRS